MPGVNLLIQRHDTPFTRYEKTDVRNASPDYSFTQFLSDLNLTENMFLVGQILLNISKLQTMYEILDNGTLTREQIAELSNRSADDIEYKKGMILFYEQNDWSYFKTIFTDQFRQGIEKYF